VTGPGVPPEKSIPGEKPHKEAELGRVVAVVNQKGGVGKTTTAVNLAAALAIAEKPTLLIDAHPQANSTRSLGFDPDPDRPSIYDGLNRLATLDELALECESLPHLQLIPSTRDLVGIEIELVAQISREYRLKTLLARGRDKYEHILIDCPPSLGLITLNSLVAADAVMIPVQAEYLALEGISQLMDTITQVREALNPDLQIAGVVMTMFDERTNLARQVVDEVRGVFGTQVFSTVIPRNVRLSEAPSHGQPIFLYDIRSKGAEAYLGLAKEFLDHETKGIGQRIEESDSASTGVPAHSGGGPEPAPGTPAVDRPGPEEPPRPAAAGPGPAPT
jgi:chromosome partitioning protein